MTEIEGKRVIHIDNVKVRVFFFNKQNNCVKQNGGIKNTLVLMLDLKVPKKAR